MSRELIKPKRPDFVKRWVFSRWRNVDNDSADVTSAGRSFHIRGLTTGNGLLATVHG